MALFIGFRRSRGGSQNRPVRSFFASIVLSGTARWEVVRHGTPSAAPKLSLSLGAAPWDLGQDPSRPDPAPRACGGKRSSRPPHIGGANCGRPAGGRILKEDPRPVVPSFSLSLPKPILGPTPPIPHAPGIVLPCPGCLPRRAKNPAQKDPPSMHRAPGGTAIRLKRRPR